MTGRVDALRGEGINAIRDIPGGGIALGRIRTVGGPDDWKYVPIRPMALLLEESVESGIEWVIFEPNDEPTWRRVRMAVESFLDELFQQRAFAGETSRASFFVRCRPDTMTRRDIDRGVVVAEVGFAPLRPAEFVVVRIQRKKQ
jgi:uncharacterized protein